VLLQELALAEGFDLAGRDEAARTHVLVEAKKLAFADRAAYLGDPEVAEGAPPIEFLLAPDYIARRRAFIRPDRALNDPPAGDLAGSDTTYFLAADRAGNAVSFIRACATGLGRPRSPTGPACCSTIG
jgi:gamma-glutamyltranspeptidase/glutathione hydrolase